MRDAIREFFAESWGAWHFVGFGVAIGLMVAYWQVTVGVVLGCAALYAIGWLARRVLLLLTGGPDA